MMFFNFGSNDVRQPDLHIYTLRDVVEGLGYTLFDSDDKYPIFDENYREVLNHNIMQHFWFREIGTDTPSRFVFFFNRILLEKMPAINVAYKTILDDKVDPLVTSQAWSDSTADTDSNTNSESKSDFTGSSIAKASDSPQDYMTDIENPKYISGLTSSEDANKSLGNDFSKFIQKYATNTHQKAYSVPLAQAITNAVNSDFINCDLLVYNELEVCFMQLWGDASQ